MLAALTRTPGPDGNRMIHGEGFLVTALFDLGEYAEAEILSRGTIKKMRRVLG